MELQEKVGTGKGLGTGRGSAAAGKDSAPSENEGAAGEAEDTLMAGDGATDTAGWEKVEPGGWGGTKELMDDNGAAGGSPAGWGTDRWQAGGVWAGT